MNLIISIAPSNQASIQFCEMYDKLNRHDCYMKESVLFNDMMCQAKPITLQV